MTLWANWQIVLGVTIQEFDIYDVRKLERGYPMQSVCKLNGSSTRFFIYPEPPFDFELSAGIHSRFKNSLPDTYENGFYRRVLHVGKKLILVSVSSKGRTEKPKLLVEVCPRLRKTLENNALRKLLESMFASSFDFNGFYALAKRDRLMKVVAESVKGLRPIPPPTIFEAVIIAITEQQISLNAAIVIRSRLIEKYGEKVMFGGKVFYAFPTPKLLAKVQPVEMKKVGLSIIKARYINEFSKKVASGGFNPERLRQFDDEKVIAELTKIKGVGRWTSEYVLVRGMGRVNSLPADDLGIQRAVSQAYFNGKKVSSEDVRKVLMKFAPYSGIAAFYLMYYMFWQPKPQTE
jgi:DNA-3-methyladenine glycosylase II